MNVLKGGGVNTITDTEYVSRLLKLCCIKEHHIGTCHGTRSSIWPLRERLEQVVGEIRKDREPERYCSEAWKTKQNEVGLESLVGD